MATSDFVRVAPDGRSFTLRGSPFYFCGANCYYMMVRLELVRVTHELLFIPQLKAPNYITLCCAVGPLPPKPRRSSSKHPVSYLCICARQSSFAHIVLMMLPCRSSSDVCGGAVVAA